MRAHVFSHPGQRVGEHLCHAQAAVCLSVRGSTRGGEGKVIPLAAVLHTLRLFSVEHESSREREFSGLAISDDFG